MRSSKSHIMQVRLFLVLFTLIVSQSAKAQNYAFQTRDYNDVRSAVQLATHTLPETLSIANDAWPQMKQNASFGNSMKYKSNYTLVKFFVDHSNKLIPPTPYVYRLLYKLEGCPDYVDTTYKFSVIDTLTIGWHPDSLNAYQDMQVKLYPNLYRARVIVLGLVNYSNPGAPTLFNSSLAGAYTNFKVELSMLYQPYVKNIYGSNMGVTTGASYQPATQSLRISWAPATSPFLGKLMPAQYQLEWLYRDDYDTLGTTIPPADLSYDFRHNATRIITDSSYYDVPLIYRRGWIGYRVRMVRPDSVNFKESIYGPWSITQDAGKIAALSSKYYVGIPHNGDSVNWNYTVSFAEGGKYKHVLGYYDGLLKNRQSVTRFNSDPNRVIVAESIYDYEGRPEIATLPVPVNGQQLRYIPGVSISSLTGQPYSAVDFDKYQPSLCPADPIAPPFDVNALASRYYSTQNHDTAAWQKYVPDAGGYPFVHTQIAPGYSDRVDKAGGAGDSLQIGMGHHMRHDYVSADQSDINLLFGLNAGWEQYYHKTVSTDQNGQHSMVIKDYEGKTVATALIGDAVDKNRHAIQRNDEVPDSLAYRDDKLANATQLTVGNQRIYNKNFYMDVAGFSDVQYIYQLPPYPVCASPFLGLSVKSFYDYSITDQCGVIKLSDTGTLGYTGVVNSSVQPAYPGTLHQVSLQQGKHTLDKTLTVNTDEIYAAVDSFISYQPNCLKTEDEFIREEVLKYDYPCVDTEDDPCSKLARQMMEELFPKAKYGYYDRNSGMVKGRGYRADSQSIFDIMPTDKYRYQDPCVTAALSQIVITRFGVTYVGLDTMNVETFLKLYTGSDRYTIARALLPLHPEYCKLQGCFNDTFEVRLQQIPNAGVADRYHLLDLDSLVAHDPLVARLAGSPTFMSHAADSLKVFAKFRRVDSLAAEMAFCSSNDADMYGDAMKAFAGDIQTLNFPNEDVRNVYFERLKGLYMGNRMKYVDMLKNAPNTCPPCAVIRMKLIPDPLVPTLYTAGGVLDISSPSSLIGMMGSSTLSGLSTLLNSAAGGAPVTDPDSLQALKDSAEAQYARINLAVNSATVDSMLSKLAGCYTTTVQRNALKSALQAVIAAHGIKFGKFQPEHVREAIILSGLTPGDLCHPYLCNYDYYDETASKSLNCKSSQYFDDVRSMLDRADIKSALANPGGSAVSIALSTANQFEAGIRNALGSGSSSYGLRSSYDATGRLYRLKVYNPGGNDTVMIALRASMVVSKGGNSYALFQNADSLFVTAAECVRTDPQVQTDGYISSFAFIAHVRRVDVLTSGNLVTQTRLLGWNNGKVSTAEPGEGSPIDRYVPYTQFKAMFRAFQDTMLAYSVLGTDHPLYNRSLRNYMNYNLKHCFSEDQYWRYMASSAITDSMRIRQYMGYSRFQMSPAAYATLSANASAAGIPLKAIMVFHKTGVTTSDSIIVNYTGLTNAQVAALVRLLPATASNRLSNVSNGSKVGILALPAGTSSGAVVPSALAASSPLSIQVWNNAAWQNYQLYELSEGSPGMQAYDLSAAIAQVSENLYTGGIQGYWLPAYYAAVNADYRKTEKRQVLNYTYNMQQQAVAKVLDSLQPPMLETQINAFSTTTVSYNSPSNPDRFTDLYYTPGATSLPGYNTLTNVLSTVASVLHSGHLFVPANTDSVYIPTSLGGASNLNAFRCHDGMYWYRLFAANNKLYNIFVRVPDYIYESQRPDLQYVDLKLGTGDSASRNFKLLLTSAYLPGDTIEAVGYTDFDLAYSRKLSDVLLGNEANYAQGQNNKGVPNVNNNCEQDILYNAVYMGKMRYRFYIDSIRTALRRDFYAYVMDNMKEQLFLSYMDQRFAITLYHYDRAGNLVSTVPPEGVHKMPVPALPSIDAARTAGNASSSLVPLHTKKTVNIYNSLNQLIKTTTPDGGSTRYWYDPKGNMALSQTDKQWQRNRHTYFLYDGQNRLIETGEVVWACSAAPVKDKSGGKTPPAPCLCYNPETGYWEKCIPNEISQGNAAMSDLIRRLNREQVVYTVYDDTLIDLGKFTGMSRQQNLRNRIAAVAYYDNVAGASVPANVTPPPPPSHQWLHCTHYSYDAAGNVATLVQDFPELGGVQQRHKRIDYEYDLYSGKVNNVAYNRSFNDQYYQRYAYDADNRIVKVESSADGIIWKRDAGYEYYQHGPLARTSLGDLRVQGIDYAYTISGWLKSINGQSIDTLNDMGGDGKVNTSIHPLDAYATTLDYFKGDYRPIGQSTLGNLEAQNRNLYNGNITRQSTDLNRFGAVTAQFNYDQLNRLRRAAYGTQAASATAITWNNAWASAYRYDQDGNILNLSRHTGTGAVMDSLDYQYSAGGTDNRLQNVLEQSSFSAPGVEDIKPYTTNSTRMLYDATGNLVKDLTSGTDTVYWNIYGKATGLKNSLRRLTMGFGYDGTGQRVIKRDRTDTDSGYVQDNEYYIRDAGGNILAVYRDEKRYKYSVIGGLQKIRGAIPMSSLALLVNNVIVPNYATHPAFAASVVAKVGSSSPMPAGYYLSQDPALQQQFVQSGTDMLRALSRYSLSAGGQPVAARSMVAQLQATAYSPDGVEQPDVEREAFVSLGNLLSRSPDPEQRKTGLGQLRSAWPGGFSAIMAAYGRSESGDSTEDVEELAGQVPEMPDQTGRALWGLYGTDRSKMPDSLGSWLALLGTDSSRYESDWDLSEGMVPYLQSSLGLQGFKNGLDTFASGWPGSWGILNPVLSGGAMQLVSYYDDPGAYLTAQVSQRGFDFIDTALADMDEAMQRSGGSFSPEAYARKVGTVIDGTAPEVLPLKYTTILGLHRHYLEEHHLYGSSRLGIKGYWPGQVGSTWDYSSGSYDTGRLTLRTPWYSSTYGGLMNIGDLNPWGIGLSSSTGAQHLLGQKQYELISHLGNVQVTVSDKRYGKDLNSDGYRDRWSSVHPAIYDYYPYGMLIPERTVRDTSGQCATITQLKYVPVYDKGPVAISPSGVVRVGGLALSSVSAGGSSGTISINTNASSQGVMVPLPSISGTVYVQLSVLTGGAYSVSVVQGGNTLVSTVADVAGVELPLVYSGTPGKVAQLKLTALHSNAGIATAVIQRDIIGWVPQTVVAQVCNGLEDRYRFGFNTQMKTNEIAGIGNHNTALHGDYDTRLARRWNTDPKPNASKSSYSMFGGNPIAQNDVLLDTPSHTAQKSGCENCKVENLQDGDYFSDVQDQTYTAKFQVTQKEFDKLKTQMKNDPGKVINNGSAWYDLVDRDGSYGVSKGDHFDIDINGPDNGFVIVSNVSEGMNYLSVTVQTLEGHPDAGQNTFSTSYDPTTQTMTWQTHNVSRSNDFATQGIGAGIVGARGIQQHQWEKVMAHVYMFVGRPAILTATSTIIEYDYNDFTNRVGRKEYEESKDLSDFLRNYKSENQLQYIPW